MIQISHFQRWHLLIRSDEGLTLESLVFAIFLRSYFCIFRFPTDKATQFPALGTKFIIHHV